jgi:AcrR family transcriptional regulator
VAKRADVARGTVYYQFSSKTGLLEALCDHLGELGGLHELPQAFTNPEPAAALATFIACFSRFWQADRAVMRRLRALAALDPDVHSVIASRDQRRYHGLELLLSRFAGAGTAPVAVERDRTVRALQAVTSFETFDTLALPNQSLEEVVPEIVRLAAAVVNQMTPRRRA